MKKKAKKKKREVFPYSSEEIRSWRRAQGWTQTDLAAKLDIGQDTVSVWEVGKSKPAGRNKRILLELMSQKGRKRAKR